MAQQLVYYAMAVSTAVRSGVTRSRLGVKHQVTYLLTGDMVVDSRTKVLVGDMVVNSRTKYWLGIW